MSHPFEHRNDNDLLTRAIGQGNEQAFNLLFRTMFRAIALYIYTIVKDKTVSEDISQETFIKLWKSRDRLHQVRNIKSYLYRIAHNECSNWLAQKKGLVVDLESDLQEIPNNTDIQKSVILTETIRRLHTIVSQLSPRVRQVFQLYYLDGRSTEEISQLLNTSVKTVMNQRKHAIKIIRDRLLAG